MARHLLKRQKAIIDNFLKVNTHSPEEKMIWGSVFTKNRGRLDIDDLPIDLWDKIVAINDTEILYQEVDRYMRDKSSEIVHNS